MHTSGKPTRALIRTALLTGAILLVCSSAFAQPGGRGQRGGQRPGPPQPPDAAEIAKMVDDMAEALSLTEAQTETVSELHVAHFATVAEITAKAGGDRTALRKTMQSLRSDFEGELRAVMRDDQIEDFEAYMKTRQPRGGQGGRRR